MSARVGQVRSVVCASPAYLDARGTPKSPAALSAHDCVSFGALTGPDRWEFRGESVNVHSRLTVNTAEAAIDAAIAGTGLAKALSYQVAAAVKAGQLRVLLKRFEPQPLPVTLVYARATSHTAKLRAFIDFTAPRLRSRLSSALARCD
jgi:DNA-binding transcriptional LysR family regulator